MITRDSVLRKLVIREPRLEGLYSYFCRPSGRKRAEMLRGAAISVWMGEHCSIDRYVYIDDRALVAIGADEFLIILSSAAARSAAEALLNSTAVVSHQSSRLRL